MHFGEKLDFLMNITKTNNSALSQSIKLDASYISRLRRGERGALKNIVCIKAMASYFAKHCPADYQQKALADALNAGHLIFDADKLPELIAQWLLDGERSDNVSTVGNFLDELSSFEGQKIAQQFTLSTETPTHNPAQVSIYYGEEGKRQASASFLSAVIAHSKPQTLLLFSDEATDWMTADREFACKWASLMFQVLKKGNKIKVIHTISRDLDEMLNAISQWMPLYMSGAIKPYFYPKKRDGVFKRTLFIAPETGAVISNSVGNMPDQEAIIFFKDKMSVEAFAIEFNQYLKLCKPLMRIFTPKDEKAYFDTLLEFEKEKSDSIVKTESLSLLTMPDTVVSSIFSRIGGEKQELFNYHNNRINLLKNNLNSSHFSEIIRLPDLKTATTPNQIKAAFSVMLVGGTAYYTLEEYILHLEHIVYLLKLYNNFHVFLTQSETDERYMVYAREDLGIIVAKTSAPPVVLAMNETNMTAAFWDYLKNIIGVKAYLDLDKEGTINKLADYINRLKQYSSSPEK